jgi:hypothetical protein
VDRDSSLEQTGAQWALSACGCASRSGTPAAWQWRRTSRVHRDGGEGERVLIAWRPRRTNSACSSSSPTPRASGCTLSHASCACCTASGTGTSRSRPPLPRRYKQWWRASARGRLRSRARKPRSSAERSPQSQRTTQQPVVALARDRAPVRDAQQVRVVGVGERLRRPGLVPRHPHARGRVLEAEIAREGSDHRQIHPHRRRRRGSSTAPTGPGQVPTVGGDYVGVEIADDRSGARARRPASPRRYGGSPRTAAGVLADAARAAIRSASANRLRSSSPGEGAAGRGRGRRRAQAARRLRPARRRRAQARTP